MKRSPLKRHKPLQTHSWPKRRRHTSKRNVGYTKDLREYIRERDEYCRVCCHQGDQVHHVIPRGRYRVHPEWYDLTGVHDERNLMWICWKCHDRAHANEANLQHVIRIQEKRFGVIRIVRSTEEQLTK